MTNFLVGMLIGLPLTSVLIVGILMLADRIAIALYPEED